VSAPSAFDWVSDELARRTGLSELEARGTLRLLLKEAGIDSKLVNKSQLAVVVARLLPASLAKLRVADPRDVCDQIGQALQSAELLQPHQSSPEDVFGRIGRR
jgi:hypothetical protein